MRVGILGAGFRGLELASLLSLEFGQDADVALIAKVDVTSLGGQAPSGALEGPSVELAADKAAFGSDRVRRWFNRSWTPVPRRARWE